MGFQSGDLPWHERPSSDSMYICTVCTSAVIVLLKHPYSPQIIFFVLYIASFMFLSMACDAPLLFSDKQLYVIMLQPLQFTVSRVFLHLCLSFGGNPYPKQLTNVSFTQLSS